MNVFSLLVVLYAVIYPHINAFPLPKSPFKYGPHFQGSLPRRLAAASPGDGSLDIARHMYSWLKSESLSSILPKEDLLLIVSEIQSDPAAMSDIKAVYIKYWTYLYGITQEEKKSLKEIIGVENSDKLLSTVESLDVYDPSTIRAFVQTPVFESMLGGILYEGIFEFLQKVDIIGNIINKLPIIGPIRVTIVKEFKNSLDRTVGAQIKTFLNAFNKVAVERMADFILSPSNRASFSKANRNLVDSVLSRPVSSLIKVDQGSNERLRDSLWATVEVIPIAEVEGILDYVYDKVGDRLVGNMIGMDDLSDDEIVAKLPTTAKRIVSGNIERFLSSDSGRRAYESMSENVSRS